MVAVVLALFIIFDEAPFYILPIDISGGIIAMVLFKEDRPLSRLGSWCVHITMQIISRMWLIGILWNGYYLPTFFLLIFSNQIIPL